MRFDSRDNILAPRSGWLAMASVAAHNRLWGSDFDFFKLILDVRRYIPVGRSHSLAVQSVLKMSLGDVPLMALSRLGGDSYIRGISGPRFQDKILAPIQAEYRLPLIWRFGLTAFAGLGRVAAKPGDLFDSGWKWAAGLGLRFMIDRKEGTNLRADFAFSRTGSGSYFNGGEAF